MRQARRWIGIGAASLALLTGCADQPASAAATVGDARIELQTVTEQLAAINEISGEPAGTPSLELTNAILRNNVVYELVQQAAEQAGVTVTQTQVDDRLADQVEFVGTTGRLQQQAAQAGVAPQMVENDIRVSLLAEALATKLAGGQDLPDQAKQQLLIVGIQAYSEEADTTVNPRFGVWEAQSLSIVADPSAPSAPAELGFVGQQ